jgi:hypothetical protein
MINLSRGLGTGVVILDLSRWQFLLMRIRGRGSFVLPVVTIIVLERCFYWNVTMRLKLQSDE